MRRLLNQITPFLLLGIGIVAFAFGIMLLAYLFLFGAVIGLILYSLAWIREKFFPHKHPTPNNHYKPGRIIDSDHWEKH